MILKLKLAILSSIFILRSKMKLKREVVDEAFSVTESRKGVVRVTAKMKMPKGVITLGAPALLQLACRLQHPPDFGVVPLVFGARLHVAPDSHTWVFRL